MAENQQPNDVQKYIDELKPQPQPEHSGSNKKKAIIIALVAVLIVLVLAIVLAAALGGDNDQGPSDGQDQTATQIPQCDDMACLDESFAGCENAVYHNELDSSSGFSEEYTILGAQDGGCQVSYKSIEQTEDEQIIEETTCLVDNDKEFLLALTEALDSPKEHSCSSSDSGGES